MNHKHQSSAKPFCRIGISLLLTLHAAGSMASIGRPASGGDNEPLAALLPRPAHAFAVSQAALSALARGSAELLPAAASLAAMEIGASGPDPEAAPPLAPNPLGQDLVALEGGLLDDIRGGFESADSHFKFSFGIERAVFINGALVSSTVLNLGDLRWIGGTGQAARAASGGLAGALGAIQNGAAPSGNSASAQPVANAGSGLATPAAPPNGPANGVAAQAAANPVAGLGGPISVIQNGAGNGVPTLFGANLNGATVIQNTLNNQSIQTATTINAVINSAQVLRAISVQSAIQAGIVGSLRR